MEKTYLNYHSRDEAVSMIIDILNKEGYNVTEYNIKTYFTPMMKMVDVKRGCDYVKNTLNSNVIVYTNNVPNKNYMEVNEEMVILDNQDLIKFALKYHNYELYDKLSHY